ncbi:Lactose permease like protein [Verticillium longisporum]|nr:Lactose permease like protein [Verticillium longisporum]
MATHEETKPHFENEEPLVGEQDVSTVTGVNATSVTLAAALAEQKPNIWSANMIRLYMIMGIGYLVSTMNGFASPQLTEFSHLDNSWAWRIPTVIQAGLPAVVMALILFFPESPRWLISHDRAGEALAILAKYHGDGDANAPINAWWDYRELFNTGAVRYRLYMVIAMSFIGQWSGNNVVSYFMPEMIKQAGITSTDTQLLLNAINPIFSMIAAVYGASLLDKLGRRKMMLTGLSGGLISYILLTAFTASSEKNPNLSYGVIVSIYLFGICFAWGFTPLQTLYSVKCLENRTRARGSGLNFLFLNVAVMVNSYGISVGMEKIGWKLYIIYIAWICVEVVIIFFFFVETADKTLEELKVVFDAPNPRNESTKSTTVTVD